MSGMPVDPLRASSPLPAPVRRAPAAPQAEPQDRVEVSSGPAPAGPVGRVPAALAGRSSGATDLATAVAASGPMLPGPVGLATAGAASLILPEAGRAYPVETEFRGRPHRFEVRFGELFARWAQKKGVLVDLSQATALRPDGKGFHLFGSEGPRQYEAATGRPAHPWLQEDPVLHYFGLPTRPVQIDLSPDGVIRSSTERPFLPDFDFLRERPNVERGPRPEELQPLAETKWLEEPLELPGDVLVYAPSAELARAAAVRVEGVLGHRAAGWAPVREALKEESARLAALDPSDPEGVKQALGAPPEEAWTAEDAATALQARQAALGHRLAPVRVFVMPRDRHWLALPFLAGLQESMLQSPAAQGPAAFLGTNMGLLVFVPEQDLGTGGFGLRHELYHALEAKFLEDGEKAALDRIHAETVRRGGPFQSLYGYQRDEFLTTMAEELEGEHGAEGPAWLAATQPELHRLLSDATGR